MKNLSMQWRIFWSTFVVALLVLSIMTFVSSKRSFEGARKSAESISMRSAQAYANDIRVNLEEALIMNRTMVSAVASARLQEMPSRAEVDGFLGRLISDNPHMLALSVGFEPNAFDKKDAEFVDKPGHDKTGRYVVYWTLNQGKPSVTALVDYDTPGAGDYYQVPKKEKKEWLMDPYIYPVNGKPTLITTAAAPILDNGEFVGITGVDIALESIQGIVAKVKPYETTTAYVISYGGLWVSHPDSSLLTKPADLGANTEEVISAVKAGVDLVYTAIDAKDGQEYLYTLAPIYLGKTDKPWGLLVKTPTKTVFASAQMQMIQQILIGLGGLLILSIAVLLISRVIAKEVSRLSESIKAATDQVTLAIGQLTQAGQQLSQSSSESAASLEETVASLEEMTSMVKLNTGNAKQAAGLSADSSTAAVDGENEMHNLIEAMSEISASSKKIEEIINVIDDIAFQTNLLALNASVEAARAGDHGKGFAVVADAVRALAQKSADAAKDITGLIKESVEKIERGAQRADKSGEVLKSIVGSVKKVSDLNTEIATASDEQSTGIGQISTAMNQLDQTVQGNAAASEEIASTAEEISSQAKIMRGAVSSMDELVNGKKAA